MRTISQQKPWPEIIEALGRADKVYLIGCGTCATMCRSGGKSEVLQMKKQLEEAGKQVTGWMVVPTACDQLTREALQVNATAVTAADAIIALTCAFGVHTISISSNKPVYPGLNTLFVGTEEIPGHFLEVCMQCGSCVLGQTGGICPLVRCAKGLLNGPCGGSVAGRCEIDPDIPCAWQEIYDRLAAIGQLDKLDEIEPVKDWGTSRAGGPRRIIIQDD